MAEHRLVEVDAAQPFDALGLAQQLEARSGVRQHGRVEGTASEVVDPNHIAQVDAFPPGVLQGGGLGLGQQQRRLHPCRPQGLHQQLGLEGTPVRRVGDGHTLGHLPFLGGHLCDQESRDLREQRIRRPGRPPEQHRRRVAEAPLEVPRQPPGLVQPAAYGGVTDEE